MAKNYVGVNLDFNGWEILKARTEEIPVNEITSTQAIAWRKKGMLGHVSLENPLHQEDPATFYFYDGEKWKPIATVDFVNQTVSDVTSDLTDLERAVNTIETVILPAKADTNSLSLRDNTTNKTLQLIYTTLSPEPGGDPVVTVLGSIDYTKFVKDSFLEFVEIVTPDPEHTLIIDGHTYDSGTFIHMVFKVVEQPGSTIVTTQDVYINVSDLMDEYQAGNGIEISPVYNAEDGAPNVRIVSAKLDKTQSGTTTVAGISNIPTNAAGGANFLSLGANGLTTSSDLVSVLTSLYGSINSLVNQTVKYDSIVSGTPQCQEFPKRLYSLGGYAETEITPPHESVGGTDINIVGHCFHIFNGSDVDLGEIAVNVVMTNRTRVTITWNHDDSQGYETAGYYIKGYVLYKFWWNVTPNSN
jgi:hypothetical protein